MKPKITILFLAFLFIAGLSRAQTADTTLVHIEMTDGNEFVGTIVSEDESVVVLLTGVLGEIRIPKSHIKSRELIGSKKMVEGKFWFDNPQSTRYFWAPNGYGLKKGEWSYQNIWVLWNQFSVGVTDNFSFGAGIIPLFLFDGSPTPVFITPKVSIPLQNEKINLGAGLLAGTVLGEDMSTFGLLYGLTTFGSRDKNMSVGIAYGFAGGEWAKSPLVNVSAMIRSSPRMYFVTENYILPFEDAKGVVLGLGGRWIIKKAALDFMVGIPLVEDMGGFLVVPVIGFTIPFGNHK